MPPPELDGRESAALAEALLAAAPEAWAVDEAPIDTPALKSGGYGMRLRHAATACGYGMRLRHAAAAG